MKKNIFFCHLLFGAVLVNFLGCKNPTPINVPNIEGVSVKNGVLVFKDLKAYEIAYEKIFMMNDTIRVVWEKKNKFFSQKSAFNQVVDAEYQYLIAPFEGKSDEEMRTVQQPQGHTNIYNTCLQKGIIKVVEPNTENETYDYSIDNSAYASIINQNGVFIVSDKLYQVKGKVIKEMPYTSDNNFSKIDQITNSDSLKNIIVNDLIFVEENDKKPNKSTTKLAAAAAAACYFPLSSGWITVGKRRGKTTITFSKTYINPYPYKSAIVTHNVNVQSQVKNIWGNWVFPSCPNPCSISGSWTFHIDIMSKMYLSYWYTDSSPRTYSYPYPNCLNNFSSSINPKTGSIAPYPSAFTFTRTGDEAIMDIRMSPVNWTVGVPGGSSGIPCGVSCN